MKTLHNIVKNLIVPVIFYNNEHPCMDHYHDGYGNERTERYDHEACTSRALHAHVLALAPATVTGRACQCANCNNNQGQWHYFISTWSERPNPGERDWNYICENCVAGACPEISPDTADQRYNPMVGLAEDNPPETQLDIDPDDDD